MSVLDQITKSRLSKGGQTSTSGVFEGTPQNVVTTVRGKTTANPQAVDKVPAVPPQPTYIDYLKTTNQI